MSTEVNTKTHIEGTLENTGLFILIVSIFALILCLIVSQNETQNSIKVVWVAIGMASIGQGIILIVVFKAGAELIRLLKKLNGLSYMGTISGTQLQTTCTECGAVIEPKAIFCTQCGVNVDKEFESI